MWELIKRHTRIDNKRAFIDISNNINWIVGGLKLTYLIDYPLYGVEEFLAELQQVDQHFILEIKKLINLVRRESL